MPKVIPIVVTEKEILVRERDTNKFVSFKLSARDSDPFIPFYHQYAEKISESQYYFKEFIRSLYGKKASKYVMAIFTPDDTTPLEKIFINEFFLHCGACKAVAQTSMSQAVSKDERYISISRTKRSMVMRYIHSNEILAEKKYDATNYDTKIIKEDAQRIHIDVEYSNVPIYINCFDVNMDEFGDFGTKVLTKDFLDKIAEVDVTKE